MTESKYDRRWIKTPLTDAQLRRFALAYRSGVYLEDLASRFGINKTEACRLVSKLGLSARANAALCGIDPP